MGAIAEGLVAYAQPLLDETDGSQESLEKAFAVAQFCFNLALLPKEKREVDLRKIKLSSGMEDVEFDEFITGVVDPMIRRHEFMFPSMHGRNIDEFSRSDRAVTEKAAPRIDRYGPCPCGSGTKYKFCCGKKPR